MLLMVCTAIVVPTTPMLLVAMVHVVLMNIKARNEERHLLAMHGDAYARYLSRTGRFIPHAGRPAR
jgi:protein-S-isoprenylcysteine O-methyltransferase Ste14